MKNTLWMTGSLLLLAFLLFPVCREDVKDRRIPNRWCIAIGGCGLLEHAPGLPITGASPYTPILFSAAGALSGFGLGLLCRGVSRDGFGWGDVKLMGALGCYLSLLPFLRGMAFTALLSMVAALYLLLVRREKTSYQLPFAPFLAAGALLSEGLELALSGGGSP